MPSKGVFIVLEGVDASGKSTQFKLLQQRLIENGHSILALHFPQYSEPSSYFVREYLKGRYGTTEQVSPYTASLFYAIERFHIAPQIRQVLDGDGIVLCDRFVPSNMVHQGTKLRSDAQRRGFYIWLDNMEYEVMGVPRPTLTFMLNVPLEIVERRLALKAKVSQKSDIHEADMDHVKKAYENSVELSRLFPKDFTRIDCMQDGITLTPEEVNDLLWEKVVPLLPNTKKNSAVISAAGTVPNPTVVTDNPYIYRSDNKTKITEAGYAYLDTIVTDSRNKVYAFTGNLNPATTAAAMARLSRRGDDMRLIILDEFTATIGKDDQLLRRVISAYGDDSVQQLAGLHLVIESATKLLTKKLEWGRLAAYLEQSTRYIYFDRQDEKGRYKFYIPDRFDKRTKTNYVDTLHTIFARYSKIVRTLAEHISRESMTPANERDAPWRSAVRAQACDIARAVLPTATETTVGIYASGQALESLIMHLLGDELPEARIVGQELLAQSRKVIPAFLERADKPERGGAMVAYRARTRSTMQHMAKAFLSDKHSLSTEPVILTDYWPRNELEIVADMLYEFSDLPLENIRRIVDSWPYERKVEVFRSYMGERLNRRMRPGRALEKIHYSWDLMCDYGIFCDLQRHRIVDDLEWQALTPMYGHETPEEIKAAGLLEDFELCFSLSADLYKRLQDAGYTDEAQYATLLGHRLRWKVTYNAREAFHLHELRTSSQGHPAYRELVLAMHQQLAGVHPLLASQMTFINREEDPELSRLAAERYSLFKLGQVERNQPIA